MATQASVSLRTSTAGWMPISVQSLRYATHLGFELYVPAPGQSTLRLYSGADLPLTVADIDRLLERGVTTVYTYPKNAQVYRDLLRERVLTDKSIPLRERYEVLAETARVVFAEAFKRRDVESLCVLSNELADQLVGLVKSGEDLVFDLVEVMLHDYSTFAHAARVCNYSLLIAQSIGIEDRESLVRIGEGALLHDVGKLFITDAIVAKDYRVTPQERELLKEHPTQGFRRLAKREQLTWDTLLMVYQHHERVDGCGYPVGLVGEEIHPWARICAIANTYDALTRDVAVENATAMDRVLNDLSLLSERSLDGKIAQCWMKAIKSNWPVS